ncbi:MAG: hypothetical protein A4E65_00259 [Syntrophorhabdus sp. PtaU1.Bin153]|nr:MAG: hypothetical protein A4E65_00259 [Syntrophorhabdus sp. PtaU1.Bin153]
MAAGTGDDTGARACPDGSHGNPMFHCLPLKPVDVHIGFDYGMHVLDIDFQYLVHPLKIEENAPLVCKGEGHNLEPRGKRLEEYMVSVACLHYRLAFLGAPRQENRGGTG